MSDGISYGEMFETFFASFNTRTKPVPVEKLIQGYVAKVFQGQIEVKTPAGSIDVLSDEYLFEIKHVSRWKHGIGQLLVYQTYYPSRCPVLWLFGKSSDELQNLIQYHCRLHRIVMSLHSVSEETIRNRISEATYETDAWMEIKIPSKKSTQCLFSGQIELFEENP